MWNPVQLPLIRGRHLAAKASFLIVAASSLGGASAQTREQVLEGTGSSVGMGFGQSVAVDGSVALVGARRGRVAGAIVGAPGKDSLVYRGGVVYASLDSPGDRDGNGIPDACEIAAGTAQDLNGNLVLDSCEVLGVALCSPAVANSTGAPSELWAFGSDTAADNNLELHVIGLPTQTLGYFLVSPDMGFAANPGGSTGNLCIVGPSIARYAGDVQSSGNGAKVMFTPDLTFVPQPNGNQSTSAGQTWCFQYWHRDFAMGSVTSNFSDARCITYL